MSHDPKEDGLPARACGCGAHLNRRTILQGAALGIAGLAGVRPSFAQDAADAMPPQAGDFLVSSLGTTPLSPDDIRINNNPTEAWAMSPEGVVRSGEFSNSILLLRYEADALPPETAAMAGEGVLGYTLICTHSGCPLNTDLDGELIACDCHGSRFDPKSNGKVAHGPAKRKLPQVALAVADGKLVIATGFDSRIGGDSVGDDDR
jgi:Rieske Fe-S protein